MPGRHSTSPSRVRRVVVLGVLLAAVVVLVASMVWIREPVLVEPMPSTSSPEFSTSPSPVPSVTPSVARSASPVPTTTRTPTRTHTPASRRSAPARVALSATYQSRRGDDGEFTSTIRVHNPGRTPQNWTIDLRFRSGVSVTQVWNATMSHRGSTIILNGGPLSAGATETVGLRAQSRSGHGNVRPTSCTVNGVACG